MAIDKKNGDIIPFLKQKDYIMVNNDLGNGAFGKTVLLLILYHKSTMKVSIQALLICFILLSYSKD